MVCVALLSSPTPEALKLLPAMSKQVTVALPQQEFTYKTGGGLGLAQGWTQFVDS